MTLGNINGVPIHSILQRIPDARLRQAYQDALEHFSSEHPNLLENGEALAHYLNPRISTHSEGIGYQTLEEQVGRGRLHADEYVAAAYLLASLSSPSRVSNGLFRINPLRAEHLILLQQQDRSLDILRRASPQDQTAMLTALRDATELGDGVLEYLDYFEGMSAGTRAAWASLELYEDHGVRTNFLDLRSRQEFPEEYYRRHVASLGLFEAEEAKPSAPRPGAAQPAEDQPPCAPDDPSCGD